MRGGWAAIILGIVMAIIGIILAIGGIWLSGTPARRNAAVIALICAARKRSAYRAISPRIALR